MLNKTLLFLLILCSTAHAGDFVCWDAQSKIISKHRSQDSLKFTNRTDCLQVSRQKVEAVNTQFYKHDGAIVGSNDDKIVEFTQAEKDAVAAAQAQAQADAEENSLQEFSISQKELITALIKRINTRIPNDPITKQEVIDQIKADR